MSSLVVAGSVIIPGGRRLEVPGIQLDSGTVTFIKGPSGCGKTSLFRKICGSAAYGGTLRSNRDIERLAIVMHEPTLIPWLTIGDNLDVEARLRNRSIPRRDFANRMADFGLDAEAAIRSGALSLGMRQRVELARGLAFIPDVMLLDEAWSGVDSTTRLAVFRTLDLFLQRTNAAILATTHADIDVLRLADRLYWFEGATLSAVPVKASIARADRISASAAALWREPRLAEMAAALSQ